MLKIIKEAVENFDQELLDFIDHIDFDDLNNILSDRLGSTVRLVPGEAKPFSGYSGKGYKIPAESDDVTEKCGIMSSVFDSVVIHLFNSMVLIDKNTNKPYFLCTPHFRYHMKEGGSNGLPICTASFTEDKGWEIRW